MLLNKIVLSKTPPTSPNTVWAKPSNGGVSLYTYSNNKWGPIQSMDDMGTDNPDDDQPGKVITQKLFDETIQDLKDYVSENYATNTKVFQIISRLNTLVGADEEGHEIDVTSVIDTFNEIKDFLANIEDTTLIELFNQVNTRIDNFSESLNTRINTLTQQVSNTLQLVGINDIPEFDSTKNYSTNDFVMYSDRLYKFIETHSAGEWNPNHVQETNLINEIDDMVKNDYENVIVSLQTEQGVPLQNVIVSIQVEGEQDARNFTTDINGRCSTQITKGYEYTVSCNDVPDYYYVDPIIKRASMSERYILVTYIEDTSLSDEHVKITFGYASDEFGYASRVVVSYGGQNYQISIVNNVAEFDIRIGTSYIITFEDVVGFRTPKPKTFTAEYHGTRPLSAYYQLVSSGIKWLMKDNTEKFLEDVTLEEYQNGLIFGLIMQTSDLIGEGCEYVIPIGTLFGAILSGQWLSSNVQVPSLPYFGSHAVATTDRNGEANCKAILDFIDVQEQQETVYTSTMVSSCKNFSGGAELFDTTKDYFIGDYVIHLGKLHKFIVNHPAGSFVEGETEETTGFLMPDGSIKKCFCPAYGQLWAFKLNRDIINDFTTLVLGSSVVAISSGDWWSSSQYNASNGVVLRSGSFFYSTNKSSQYYVLPVLAY